MIAIVFYCNRFTKFDSRIEHIERKSIDSLCCRNSWTGIPWISTWSALYMVRSQLWLNLIKTERKRRILGNYVSRYGDSLFNLNITPLLK